MPIRFPKIHLAQSVVNQILDVADGIEQTSSTLSPAPQVPQTAGQSAAIDARLSVPVSGELPQIQDAPDPGGTLSGDRLLDTVLNPKD